MALLIQNAVFNYVCIKNPKLEFEKQADLASAHMNREYIVDVLMPYASWKKFKKHYKAVGAIEKAKSHTPEEYKAAFKVDGPDAEVYGDEDGDYTVIKFRQRAYYKDSGDAAKQPSIVGTKKIKNGNGDAVGFKDSLGQDVGVEIEVGNGSVGTLQFRERSWKFGGKDGLSLDLVAIQVKELVAFESKDELAFDMDEEVADSEAPFEGGADLDGSAGEASEQAPEQETDDSATGW